MSYIPDVEPCPVPVDIAEFAKAIIKLVENAITYTPEGGSITIGTHQWQDQTIISVQDTGIGITADDLPHIFERFYRADQARSTATGGHGLGLSIAQSIIEAHGGSLKAESAPGKGSTFTVTLLNSEPVIG